MAGRNINPENRDFIVREAERIINEYIRESKAHAGERRKKRLRGEFARKRVTDLAINISLVLSMLFLIFLLFKLF